MTPDEKRRGQLMVATLSRELTPAEREELVALLVPDSGVSSTEEADSA